jgi:hypothetical protein
MALTAGELGALLAHIGFQIGDERRALRLANSLSLVGALAIDRALDLEQGVDAAPISMATGEMTISFFPAALRRAFSSRSAMAKNGRRAWTQQRATSDVGTRRVARHLAVPCVSQLVSRFGSPKAQNSKFNQNYTIKSTTYV